VPPGYGGPPLGQTPWERRDQIGFLTALVETTKQVLSQPVAFFRAMPTSDGIGAPLLYALVVGYVGLFASTVYSFVFQSVIGASLARMGGTTGSDLGPLMPFLHGGVGLVVNLIFGPVFITIGVFLLAGIVHLALLAIGGATGGFEATFRVVAYSEAAGLFNVIPLCGGLIGFVYMLVLLVIGLSEAQRISRGKAATGVLLPVVVLCCCCVGVIVAIAVAGGFAGVLGHAR